MSSTEDQYEKILEKIGINIKKTRMNLKLSQSDMIKHGFELRNYQRLESGKHSPSLFTLHRLALIFSCSISDFFQP